MCTKKIATGANPVATKEQRTDLREILLYSTLSPHFRQTNTNRFIIAHFAPRGDLSVKQEKALIFADAGARCDCRTELGISTPIPRLSKAEAWALLDCVFSKQEGVIRGE